MTPGSPVRHRPSHREDSQWLLAVLGMKDGLQIHEIRALIPWGTALAGKEAEKAGGGAAPNNQMWFHSPIPKGQSWKIIWMQMAPRLFRAQGSLGDRGFGDNARSVGTLLGKPAKV